jgi:hypothetical protein
MSKVQCSVSESLSQLRRFFADYEGTGVQLSGDAVRTLRSELKEMLIAARRIEHAAERSDWKRPSADRETTNAVVAELGRPDSNLRLFPVIHRTFHDGQGGAA